MIPLEATSKLDEKLEEPWRPNQRLGVPGVDYDDYGAEMAPNARVWKKYVEETDRTDKELVERWNSMLDIILIFAALFSAISTAFVIESSKDLKPDYAQHSAQTLFMVSRSLSAISRGVSIDESTVTNQELLHFTPSYSAVIVNTLWFLSLSLSVAVSLVAILAKDWCSSFIAGRIGSILRQGRLRQQRWDGIQRWRMKEILYLLPLLLHIALLLFAIGLSLYLWDINIGVALPVIITTSLTALFYVATTLLPLFFRFCPYSTALVRFVYPHWIAVLTNRRATNCIGVAVAAALWILHHFKTLKQRFFAPRNHPPGPMANGRDLETTVNLQPDNMQFSFGRETKNVNNLVQEWLTTMRDMFSTDRLLLSEQVTPMDAITSSMLNWMIANCEDPKLVDMALQALAGAEPQLPRQALWDSGALELVSQRLSASISPLEFSFGRNKYTNEGSNEALNEASLYSRAFGFITAFVNGEGINMENVGHADFVYKKGLGPVQELRDTAMHARWCLLYLVTPMLSSSWNRFPPRYEIAAFELNSLPIGASTDIWDWMNEEDQQCSQQWQLLELASTGKVTNLPTKSQVAMLNGITKTYLFKPSQSPIPLVRFLRGINSSNVVGVNEIKYAIGTALAVAAFATGNHPASARDPNLDLDLDNRDYLKQTRRALDELVARESCSRSVLDTLLLFGLLSLVTHKVDREWTYDVADIKLIGECLGNVTITNPVEYNRLISIIPTSFNFGQHVARVLSECLAVASDELDGDSATDSPAQSRVRAILTPYLLARFSRTFIFDMLLDHFTRAQSWRLKELCLRAIHNSIRAMGAGQNDVFDKLSRTDFLKRLLEATTTSSERLAPQIMVVLWDVSCKLIENLPGSEEAQTRVLSSLLGQLHNRFIANQVGGSSPAIVDDMGFLDLWIHTLDDLRRTNPQSLIDSSVIEYMLSFYQKEKYANITPRSTELPFPFDATWSWLRILSNLEERCKTIAEEEAQTLEQDKTHETISYVSRQGEHEWGNNLRPNLYWAM